jgi:hypothetical protein
MSRIYIKQCCFFFIITPTDALISQIYFLAKINFGNQCVCWFYYKEIYCDAARSHERKIAVLLAN